MSTKCIIFETVDELLKLTGLTCDEELRGYGFDLDDWDIGFCSNEKLDEKHWWLESKMDSHACGYQTYEYEGRYYYLVYHA